MYGFSEFINWTFDLWEVACVSTDMGHTLSRLYKLLLNSADAFQRIYGFLANASLKPTIKSERQANFIVMGGAHMDTYTDWTLISLR